MLSTRWRISFMPSTVGHGVLAVAGDGDRLLRGIGHQLGTIGGLLHGGAHFFDGGDRLGDGRVLLVGAGDQLGGGGLNFGGCRADRDGRLAHLARHLVEVLHHLVEVQAQLKQVIFGFVVVCAVTVQLQPGNQIAVGHRLHEDHVFGNGLFQVRLAGAFSFDHSLQVIRHAVEGLGQVAHFVVGGDVRAGRRSPSLSCRAVPCRRAIGLTIRRVCQAAIIAPPSSVKKPISAKMPTIWEA